MLKYWYLTVLVVVLAACGAPIDETPESIPVVAGTEWVLTSLDGEVPIGPEVTLSFTDNTITGWTGCNQYGATYQLDEAGFRVESVEVTEEACPDVERAEQQSVFIAALEQATELDIVEETRMLIASGAQTLEFEQRSVVAFDEENLFGASWTLQELNGAPPTGETPITLMFEQSRLISGYAGCRTYTGDYLFEGGRVTVTALSMGEDDCGDDTLLAQEGVFTEGLSSADRVFINENGALIIESQRGGELVFTR